MSQWLSSTLKTATSAILQISLSFSLPLGDRISLTPIVTPTRTLPSPVLPYQSPSFSNEESRSNQSWLALYFPVKHSHWPNSASVCSLRMFAGLFFRHSSQITAFSALSITSIKIQEPTPSRTSLYDIDRIRCTNPSTLSAWRPITVQNSVSPVYYLPRYPVTSFAKAPSVPRTRTMYSVLVASSEEEDEDIYLNSVARLKALKMKGLQKGKVQELEPEQPTKPMELAELTCSHSTRSSQAKKKRVVSPKQRRGGRQRQVNSVDLDIVEVTDVEISSANNIVQNANDNSTSEDSEVIMIDDSQGSGDEENYDVNVNVLWRSKTVHRLNMKRQENFRKIFEHFAKLEGVAIEEILITRKEKPVRWTDTPASIDFRIIDILEGGVVERTGTVEIEEDSCQIRVQLAEKSSLTVQVRRDESFAALFRACAEKVGVAESKIKLLFDGEHVTLEDTPDSLDIEDEACFDLRVCS